MDGVRGTGRRASAVGTTMGKPPTRLCDSEGRRRWCSRTREGGSRGCRIGWPERLGDGREGWPEGGRRNRGGGTPYSLETRRFAGTLSIGVLATPAINILLLTNPPRFAGGVADGERQIVSELLIEREGIRSKREEQINGGMRARWFEGRENE